MRLRNTLIMAAVALVLGAAVYFLEIRGAAEREEAEAVADRLLRFETDEVTGITLDTTAGTFVLARIDDTWRITEPYDLAADQTAVTSLINRLESGDHDRIVEEQPEDLARFGLDEPEVSVTVTLAGGDRRTLHFGDGTPVGFNVFVKRDDADTVFTAAAGIKDAVDKSLFDLRDRRVLTFADADVERLEIERGGLDATLERQPDAGDGIDRWALREPLQASADTETVSNVLRQLRTGNAVAFATDEPTAEELTSFGLDEPEVTVRVWTGDDAATTLQIGGAAEEPAGRYARRLGADAVMIVPNNLVNELPESVDALRNRSILAFARDRVEAIEVIGAGGEPVRLEKDGVDWHIRSPRPLEGDTSTVSALLTAALGLRTLEFPEGDPAAARFGVDEPHGRVTFELESMPGDDEAGLPAETVVVRVGAATEVAAEEVVAEGEDEPEPTAARYVSVDGDDTVYVVEEADLEDMLPDLFALRSKTLVSFAQSDLTRLEVTTPQGTHELARNEDGNWTRDGEPVADEAAVDDLLWRLNYLDMQGVVAEPTGDEAIDAAAYGLAQPAWRVRAWIGDEVVADVAVGDDVPEDELQELPPFAARTQVYAQVGGTPAIVRIDATLRDAAETLVEALD